MDNHLQVETAVEAGTNVREVRTTRCQVQRVVCVPALALAGACLLVALGWTFSRQPSLSHIAWAAPSDEQLHDVYKGHEKDIAEWSDNAEDPCILVRYGCVEMKDPENCAKAGTYCSWVVVPGQQHGTCIKSNRDSNDFCAVLDEDGCAAEQSRHYGCIWKNIDKSIFPPGGYCIESENAQIGCDESPIQFACEQLSGCEWISDSQKTERRLQFGGLPLPGGSCRRKRNAVKDDCCTALGPDHETCGMVSGLCEWTPEERGGKGKCKSNGVAGSVGDDVKREHEEFCRNQGNEKYCEEAYLLSEGCVWKDGKCEARNPPPS